MWGWAGREEGVPEFLPCGAGLGAERAWRSCDVGLAARVSAAAPTWLGATRISLEAAIYQVPTDSRQLHTRAQEMSSLLEMSESERLRLHHVVSQLQQKLAFQAKELSTLRAGAAAGERQQVNRGSGAGDSRADRGSSSGGQRFPSGRFPAPFTLERVIHELTVAAPAVVNDFQVEEEDRSLVLHAKEGEYGLVFEKAKHLEAELVGIRAMAQEMSSLLEMSESERLRLHHVVCQLQQKLAFQAKELSTLRATSHFLKLSLDSARFGFAPSDDDMFVMKTNRCRRSGSGIDPLSCSLSKGARSIQLDSSISVFSNAQEVAEKVMEVADMDSCVLSSAPGSGKCTIRCLGFGFRLRLGRSGYGSVELGAERVPLGWLGCETP